MTFVDTAAWFALYVRDDPLHGTACLWIAENPTLLFTTDYIVDETITLMRARGQRLVALDYGRDAFSGRMAKIHYLKPDEIDAAWQVFRDFDDKDWSFTDCTSKVVIEQFGIETAFTFDHHFRQFGTVVVVP